MALRINKASGALGALRKEIFGTKYASYEADKKFSLALFLRPPFKLRVAVHHLIPCRHSGQLAPCSATRNVLRNYAQAKIHRITTEGLYEGANFRQTREKRLLTRRNNKHVRCVRASAPVYLPPAPERVQVHFNKELFIRVVPW